jgi:hypothetical protein
LIHSKKSKKELKKNLESSLALKIDLEIIDQLYNGK